MKCEIKYAPTNLDEVIYPGVAVERRIKGYASGQLEGHIILHGSNGTGKSTLAKLLVAAIGGVDASVETMIAEELLAQKELRYLLLNSTATGRLTTGGKHFLVLDEFDQAKKGIGEFWRALDACGDGVMAIMTTNEPMEIHRSIRSRCDVIEMPGISAIAVLPRVQFALQSEGLHLPDQQVLHYLKSMEHWKDLRKYFKVANELLFLHSNGLQLPVWNGTPPAFKVI